MSKPKIYSTCKAGCKWETIHRSEFEESATRAKIQADNNGSYVLKEGKLYQVYLTKNESNDGYTNLFHVIFTFGSVGSNTVSVNMNIPFDKYKEFITIKLLGMNIEETGSSGVKRYMIDYEVDGERKNDIILDSGKTGTPSYYMKVSNSPKVYIVNEGELSLPEIGNLEDLKTTNKTSIVAAINELYDLINNQ